MAEIVVKLVNGELAGKTAQSISKEINAAAAATKKAEIGTKAWLDAHARLKEAKELQEDLKEQIEATTAASDMLKAAWNKLPGASFFNDVAESFGMFKKGVGGLVDQFGVLKVAIASTGLGLLLIVIAALVGYFTQTQEGIDKITAVTRPLTAVFTVLKNLFFEFGSKIFKQLAAAVENPKKAFEDLGKMIQDNIINRLKAFALFWPAIQKIFSKDWKEGMKDLANATLQLGTGVENLIDKVVDSAKQLVTVVDEAYEKGKRIDELQKQIERGEIDQIKRTKQLDLIIKQQKYIIEDVTKSWDERREAAQKALAAQETLLTTELALLDKRIAKMKLEQSLGNVTREQEKELAELEAERLGKEAEITEQRIEFRNKINEFDKAQYDEYLARLKAERDAYKKHVDELRQIEDTLLEARKDSREKDLQELQLWIERQIEDLDSNSDLYAAKLAALQELARAKRKQVNDKWDALDLQKLMDQNDLLLARELNSVNERYLNKSIKEKEYLDSSEQLAIVYQARNLALIKKAHGEESAEYVKAYAQYLSLQKAQADRAVDIKKKELEDQKAAMAGSLGTFGDFFGSIASFQKQGTNQWKAFATAQAIMSAVQGAMNAYTSTAAIPVVGPILAPVAAGVALAAGYANVREIQNTKVEAPVAKAEGGFVLRGPSHAQGGIPIEAEGDEIILTKGVYRNPYLRKMASDINVAGGGIRFAAGGPVNPIKSTPSGLASIGRNDTRSQPGFNEVVDALYKNIEATNARIDRLKVVNVATETQQVNDEILRIKNTASV